MASKKKPQPRPKNPPKIDTSMFDRIGQDKLVRVAPHRQRRHITHLEKLDPRDRVIIMGLLSAGVWRAHALALFGITAKMWAHWSIKAKEGEQPFADFIEEVYLHESIGKEKYLSVLMNMIHNARSENTRLKALTFFLERRWPKEFGSRAIHQTQDGEDGELAPMQGVVILPPKEDDE